MKKYLNKIWPWSKINELTVLMHAHMDQSLRKSKEIRECDSIIASWQKKYAELEKKYDGIELNKNEVEKELNRQRLEAKGDVRSGKILGDRQQATDIKFRAVKIDVQVMKKLNKQASMAIRYVAQQVKSNAIQSDLRAIADLIHPDAFNAMGIENMSSSDMVMDTKNMKDMIALSGGRKDPEL